MKTLFLLKRSIPGQQSGEYNMTLFYWWKCTLYYIYHVSCCSRLQVHLPHQCFFDPGFTVLANGRYLCIGIWCLRHVGVYVSWSKDLLSTDILLSDVFGTLKYWSDCRCDQSALYPYCHCFYFKSNVLEFWAKTIENVSLSKYLHTALWLLIASSSKTNRSTIEKPTGAVVINATFVSYWKKGGIYI